MNKSINKRKTKLTTVEILSRVDHIIDLLAQNKKRAQIMKDKVVLEWDMTQSSIDKYIKHARDDIALNSKQARSEHLSRSILNLTYLYKINLELASATKEVQYFRLCLDIQKELDRVLKLDEAYSPTVSSSGKETAPEAVRAMLDGIDIINPPDRIQS